jgi:hypothetical protein
LKLENTLSIIEYLLVLVTSHRKTLVKIATLHTLGIRSRRAVRLDAANKTGRRFIPRSIRE